MGELIDWFLDLPRLTQIALAAGILSPLLILFRYLAPPPPPPPPPARKNYQVQGDVTLKERHRD